MTPLRVCIDARLGSGLSGGVEQVLIGLTAALSRLDDGEEEYLILAHAKHDHWIRPYVSGRCRLVHTRMEYPGEFKLARAVRDSLSRRIRIVPPRPTRLVQSDGTIERLGVDVVHFMIQEAFVTDVPSIYHPQDLLHLHFPELLGNAEVKRREVVYRAFCEQAELVGTMTSWGRDDLMLRYGLPKEKIAIVNWGSAISDYPTPGQDDLEAVRDKFALPPTFLLYPAQTWPHKNHLALLDAIARVRERSGLTLPLVCPGRRNEFFNRLEERVRELGLQETVWFPGFVGPGELRAMYSLATMLVFPSKFEGWGMPVCEAFAMGVPVASSWATSLREVVGDAGLAFDPDDPDEIANAIQTIWTDPGLQKRLVARGKERAELFSVDLAARRFRAHYRRIAGRRLSEEDRILLGAEPAESPAEPGLSP